MKSLDALKLFGLNNLAIEASLRRLQRDQDIDLGHREQKIDPEEKFYPQFSEKMRAEAADMARQYAIFYCLENSVRDLIAERLAEIQGPDWWNIAVPPNVRDNAAKNRKKESQAGVTLRSTKMIDYSNFGELGEILKSNWDTFGETFRDIDAVQRVLANLNTLRAPIAHCKVLAEDEIVRLHLSLRDWFRQMS